MMVKEKSFFTLLVKAFNAAIYLSSAPSSNRRGQKPQHGVGMFQEVRVSKAATGAVTSFHIRLDLRVLLTPRHL